MNSRYYAMPPRYARGIARTGMCQCRAEHLECANDSYSPSFKRAVWLAALSGCVAVWGLILLVAERVTR